MWFLRKFYRAFHRALNLFWNVMISIKNQLENNYYFCVKFNYKNQILIIICDLMIDVKFRHFSIDSFPLTSRRSASDNGNEMLHERLSLVSHEVTRKRLLLSFSLPTPFLSFTFPIHLSSCFFYDRVSSHPFSATITDIAIRLSHTPRDISGQEQLQ